MKTILTAVIILCLCLTLFTACEKPTPTTQTPGTTDTTGTEYTESTANTTRTNDPDSNESTGSTGITASTESSFSQESATLQGESITDDQFEAPKTNCPTNYTYTEVRSYNGKAETIHMMVNGEEFMETITEGTTVTRKLMGILQNGKIKNYQYNATTGKWDSCNTGKTLNYPLNGFPIPLSEFTFDAATGIYKYTMTNNGTTAEMQLAFKDGMLVYLGQFSGENQSTVTFQDYASTVIPVPDTSDLVETSPGKNTSADQD